MKPYLEYTKETFKAVQHQSPIVALESTLITHGLPYPENLQIAQESEAILRDQGVIPATIAIMNGKIKIGLTPAEVQSLAQSNHAIKVSTRDIPFALSQNLLAGTTVSSTLFCAHLAGIRLFATGGIGGVHRETHFDISADLLELARTPIAIISAGMKSILDLPNTLEFLETQSVPVIGYQTSVLPAFYSATSQHRLATSVSTMPELSQLLHTHWELGCRSGILIANPVPVADEIPANEIEPFIQSALQSAKAKGITGKAVTPYLLSELASLTKGRTLKTNLSLIRNNVKVAAELAKCLSE